MGLVCQFFLLLQVRIGMLLHQPELLDLGPNCLIIPAKITKYGYTQ